MLMQQGQIADLIFSLKFGKRSFNLDAPERTACVEALWLRKDLFDPDPSESIASILGRYHDIEEECPENLRGKALTCFVDWLIESLLRHPDVAAAPGGHERLRRLEVAEGFQARRLEPGHRSLTPAGALLGSS